MDFKKTDVKHIVYICREYGESKRGGGIARYLQQMAEGMLCKGWKVTVIAASDDTREERLIQKGDFSLYLLSGGDFYLPQVETSGWIWYKFRFLYRFFSYRKKILKTLNSLPTIDLIEVSEYGAESWYLQKLPIPQIIRLQTPALLDRKTQGVKKFSLKTIPDWFVGYFEHQLIRRAKYISSCSASLKDWVVANVPVKDSRIEVLYNALYLQAWNFDRTKRDFSKMNVLYAGTVSQEKGVEDLLNAIILLRTEGYDVSLTIAGKLGTFGSHLQKRALEESLSWCTFHGHVNKQELIGLYEQASIACFPSWWEALGLVCLEAMYSGTLVVGSQEGGMAEIITDGKDGFLVQPKSAELIKEKLKEVITLPLEQKLAIAQAGVATVSTYYSQEYILESTLKYYEDILSETSSNENSLG